MKKRNLFVQSFVVTLSVIMVICFAVTNIAWASNKNGRHVQGELLIRLKAGVSKSKMQGILAHHGAVTAGEIDTIKVRLIKVPIHALEKVKTALEKNQNISFVEHNFIAQGAIEPNDERYSSQWHLPKISAPDGWNMCTGSDITPIAIIDSGVDPTHPDLSDKLLTGYNFLENNNDTHDVRGHGTAVAGTAAAISNNIAGVAGLAWENPIMPLVVLNSDDWASYYDIARAITYAADHNIRVINISLGGSSSSLTMQNAINYAWNKGTLVFASAGNYATNIPCYPAACEHVVAVSATTSNDTLASFSNYGNWIDIAAPGASILTTNRGGGYGYWNGTSFSSPIAAGLAGLIISANPDLTNTQVVEIITQNADDLGDPGFDAYYGYGRINVYASLVAAIGTESEPDMTDPLISITSPEEGLTMSSSITVRIAATDNVMVEKVELYIDGALFGTNATEPHNFYWNTNDLLEGYYELSAIAYDSSGNIGHSNSVTVYVHNQQEQDTTQPVVSITSPTDGAYLSKLVKITVLASDNIGVTRMQLYVDGLLRVDKLASSISWTWNVKKESNGAHIILLKAYDDAKNIGTASITLYK